MSLVSTQNDVHTIFDNGPEAQCALTTAQIGLNTSIAGSGSSVSNVIQTNGYKYFSFGIKSNQTGTVSIQRYIDQAGTIPVSTAITGNLSSNTALSIDSVDDIPYQSMIITVSNSAGSTATLSNCLLLLQAS